jgi:hypothetical protein
MKSHGNWLKVILTNMDTSTSSSEADGSIDCDTSEPLFMHIYVFLFSDVRM